MGCQPGNYVTAPHDRRQYTAGRVTGARPRAPRYTPGGSTAGLVAAGDLTTCLSARMAPMAPLIDRVLPAAATAAFCAKWGVSELYVFGSAARGELRDDSDLDVAVRFRQGTRYSLFELIDMKDELTAIAGRAVDLFTIRGIEHMPNLVRRQAILDSLELVHAA